MEYKSKKSILLMTTYGAVLILIILNFSQVAGYLKHLISIFEPLVYGIVIAFVFNRPCLGIEKFLNRNLLKNRHQPAGRVISIAIAYMAFFIFFMIFLGNVIPQLINSIQDLLKNIDSYSKNLQSIVNQATAFMGLNNIDLTSMFTWTAEYVNHVAADMIDTIVQIINLTKSGMGFIANFLFSIIFSIYFLFDKEKLLSQCKKAFHSYLPENKYELYSYRLEVITDTFNNYFIGQILEAFILGVLCFIGMVVFGFHYPMLISILIGVTALVPLVGPLIGGLVGFRILVMIAPVKALYFIIFILILQQIEGNIIYPKIIGKKIGLPAVWVLLSITVGAGLGGIVGIIVGVPIAAVFYRLLKDDVNSRILKAEKNGN